MFNIIFSFFILFLLFWHIDKKSYIKNEISRIKEANIRDKKSDRIILMMNKIIIKVNYKRKYRYVCHFAIVTRKLMQVKEICSRTEEGGCQIAISTHIGKWSFVRSLIRSQCSGMRKFARSFVHSFVFFFFVSSKNRRDEGKKS